MKIKCYNEVGKIRIGDCEVRTDTGIIHPNDLGKVVEEGSYTFVRKPDTEIVEMRNISND